MSGAWIDRLERHPPTALLSYISGCSWPRGKSKRGQRCYLVPIQIAVYILVLYAVADRPSVRTRSRIAASEPLLYQRLHLFVRELIAQLYRRVARYGGQDPLLSAHSRGRTPHGRDGLPKTSCHITALCQGRDHPVYPEGVLAEGLNLKAVDRKLLKRIGCLRGIPWW